MTVNTNMYVCMYTVWHNNGNKFEFRKILKFIGKNLKY